MRDVRIKIPSGWTCQENPWPIRPYYSHFFSIKTQRCTSDPATVRLWILRFFFHQELIQSLSFVCDSCFFCGLDVNYRVLWHHNCCVLIELAIVNVVVGIFFKVAAKKGLALLNLVLDDVPMFVSILLYFDLRIYVLGGHGDHWPCCLVLCCGGELMDR